MALVLGAVVLPVVETRRIHTLSAALALAATRVDLDRHTFADAIFVDARAEGRDGAHIFVTRCEVLIRTAWRLRSWRVSRR